MSDLEVIDSMKVPCDYLLNGWIYVLKNKFFSADIYKIGMTTRTPEERAKELSSTGVPSNFDVVLAYQTDNPARDEALIHSFLSDYRINESREFFQCDIQEIKDAAYECGLVERNELVEVIAITNDIISFRSDRDSINEIFKESGIIFFGDENSIKNEIFKEGLKVVMQKIKTEHSLVITKNKKVFIKNYIAREQDKINGGNL